jgi:hypothetical protein
VRRHQRHGSTWLRRAVVTSLALGMLFIGLASPATATVPFGRWAPTLRLFAATNDDGWPGRSDPADVGWVSAGYDRWGSSSSDDPAAVGMDPIRQNADVARCMIVPAGPSRVEVRIDNAYPGYVCTIEVSTVNRSRQRLAVDAVTAHVVDSLNLYTITAPEHGDVVKPWRHQNALYAIEVTQAAPEGEELHLEIVTEYAAAPHMIPPRCCHRCGR